MSSTDRARHDAYVAAMHQVTEERRVLGLQEKQLRQLQQQVSELRLAGLAGEQLESMELRRLRLDMQRQQEALLQSHRAAVQEEAAAKARRSRR